VNVNTMLYSKIYALNIKSDVHSFVLS